MHLPGIRWLTLAGTFFSLLVLVSCSGSKDAAGKSLVGKWDGISLTRTLDGQPAEITKFAPGDCTMEVAADGTYRVTNQVAPYTGQNGAPGMPASTIVFTGHYKVLGAGTLQMTLDDMVLPDGKRVQGTTDEMSFVVDAESLVTLSPVKDQRTGRRVGTTQASYRRVETSTGSSI